MENPSLNISLLCLAPKYLDLILWALSFGLHWRVDVHERASNHHGLRSFVRALAFVVAEPPKTTGLGCTDLCY